MGTYECGSISGINRRTFTPKEPGKSSGSSASLNYVTDGREVRQHVDSTIVREVLDTRDGRHTFAFPSFIKTLPSPSVALLAFQTQAIPSKAKFLTSTFALPQVEAHTTAHHELV